MSRNDMSKIFLGMAIQAVISAGLSIGGLIVLDARQQLSAAMIMIILYVIYDWRKWK